MKKIILLILIFVMIIGGITVCYVSKTKNKSNDTDKNKETNLIEVKGNDYTIKDDLKHYDDIESKKIIEVKTNLNFSHSLSSIEKMISLADNVIEFVVEDLNYRFIEGTGYTIYNIKITKVFAGSLKEGDKISLLQYGGIFTIEDETNYWHDEIKFSNLTEEEKNNTLIVSRAEECVDYHKGDNFVAFISKEDLIDGAYSTLNCGEGVFYYQDKDKLVRYSKKNYKNNEITYDKLVDITKDMSKK